jgi:hypothetical protein
VPTGRLFAGILPFRIAILACVAILVASPLLAPVLPNTMIR